MLELVQLHMSRQNATSFSLSPGEVLEYAVLEFSFSFWQWGGDCEKIPGPDEEAEVLFDYINDIVSWNFYSNNSISYYLPSFYQFMTELGYYGFLIEPVKDLLVDLKNPSNLRFAPQDTDLTYKPYLQKVVDFLDEKGDRVLYIYGGYDTWTACGYEPKPGIRALRKDLVKGSHTTRINSFDPLQKREIFDSLSSWLGIEVPVITQKSNDLIEVPSKAECLEFGNNITQSLRNGETKTLNDAYYYEGFSKIIFPEEDALLKDLREGFLSGIKANLQLGNTFASELNDEADSFELLKYYENEGVPHLIFRLFTDNGLNYHDFTLTKVNGAVKIVDVYIYLVGEKMSDAFRRNFYNSTNNINFEAERANQQAYIDEISMQRQIWEQMQVGNYQGAYELYQSLPNEKREEKQFQVLSILITQNLSDEIYQQSIDTFNQLFPKDRSLPLLLIDGYFIRKEYDKLLVTLDNLEKSLGGDPVLDFFRATVALEKKEVKPALEYLNRLANNKPDFRLAWMTLLQINIDIGKYQEAVDNLIGMEKHLGMDKAALEKLIPNEQSDFINSEVYKSWKG